MSENHIIKALDLISQDEFESAHQVVQYHSDRLSCQIHAYLHRRKNEMDNARYWYEQVGEELPTHSLEKEFSRLVQLAESAE